MKSVAEEVLDRLSRAEAEIRNLRARLGSVEKVAHPSLDLPPVVELVDAVYVLRALEALVGADRVVLSLSPDGTMWTATLGVSSGFGSSLSEAVRNLLSPSLSTPGEGVIHILHGGLPLCGFTRDLPRDWPDGHSWIGLAPYRDGSKIDDAERARLCDACLDKEDD